MDPKDIARMVDAYLRATSEPEEHGIEYDVLAGGIREDDGWWYVPVRRRPRPTHTWKYYEYLTDIEDAIKKDHDDVDVLLIPAS